MFIDPILRSQPVLLSIPLGLALSSATLIIHRERLTSDRLMRFSVVIRDFAVCALNFVPGANNVPVTIHRTCNDNPDCHLCQ